MLNKYKYNEKPFDFYETSEAAELFNKSPSGVNFGNDLFFPNKNVCSLEFEYLDKRALRHKTSRLTSDSLSAYDLTLAKGATKIKAVVEADTREELLTIILNLKKEIDGKKVIILKDGKREFINNYIVENFKVEEKHYNNCWAGIEIFLVYYEHIQENKNLSLKYPEITENNKNFDFSNSGQETNYKALLEISTTNIYTFSLNNIEVFQKLINAGSYVEIDSRKQEVKIDGTPLVFSGIISKIKPGINAFTISDDGTNRNYSLSIRYKNTFK